MPYLRSFFSPLLYLVAYLTASPIAMAETEALRTSLHCPAFIESPHYRAPANTLTASPDNWIQVINQAAAGDEVLLEDGVYTYDSYAVVLEKPITLRGKSGIASNVTIQGRGYGQEAEGLMVMAPDVHIADLTIRDVHHHAISLQGVSAGTVIYNVELIDIGTQHIKGNGMGPNGLIACSSIGYGQPTGTGDYNGGINLHGANNWVIRDNHIYNIFGDGSGCVVDSECGTQYPGGGAAILLWNDASENIIERNVITESFRGIVLGLNTLYSGGLVKNNFIYRRFSGQEGVGEFIEADTGISLIGASNVVVEGNTVMLAGEYPGVVEVWKANGNTIRNNLISKPVWNRGDAGYSDCNDANIADCEQKTNTVIGHYAHSADQPLAMQTQAIANSPSTTSTMQDPGLQTATGIQRKISAVRDENLDVIAERLKLKEERLNLREQQLNQIAAEIAWRENALLETMQDIQLQFDSR